MKGSSNVVFCCVAGRWSLPAGGVSLVVGYQYEARIEAYLSALEEPASGGAGLCFAGLVEDVWIASVWLLCSGDGCVQVLLSHILA